MKNKLALCILKYSLGIVILIEAVLFVLPSAAHDFARTHMPGLVRMILGWGEIAGCILLLIPKTTIRGAWFLFRCLRIRDSDSPVARPIQRRQRSDLRRGGFGDCHGKRSVITNRDDNASF